MTSDVDLVMSNEFVAYAKKITNLLAQRRIKEKEYRAMREKILSEIDELNNAASVTHSDFEKWKAAKKSQITGVSKGLRITFTIIPVDM